MTRIQYREGDLFETAFADKSREIVIPHVCNNIGAFGAGFAKALHTKWPNVAAQYLAGTKMLGDTHFVEVEDKGPYITVANMIAQRGLRGPDNHRPLRYSALMHCMNDVGIFAFDKKAEIFCPLFGAGLAGGEWKFIEMLIDELWVDRHLTVTVCYLNQAPKNIKSTS